MRWKREQAQFYAAEADGVRYEAIGEAGQWSGIADAAGATPKVATGFEYLRDAKAWCEREAETQTDMRVGVMMLDPDHDGDAEILAVAKAEYPNAAIVGLVVRWPEVA